MLFRIQLEYSKNIDCTDSHSWTARTLTTVAGVDVSPVPNERDESAVAALVILSFPGLDLIAEYYQVFKPDVAYIPGFLGFRECPVFSSLIAQSSIKPQLIFVDGFGILHPRKCGSASQLGLMTGIPTIGVAKNILHVGEIERRVINDAVADLERIALKVDDEICGAAVKPKGCSKPIYISVGHKISLETAITITLECCRHRVPEPIRQADLRSRERARNFILQNRI